MQIRRPILLFMIWLLIAALGAFWVWQSAKTKMSSSDDAMLWIQILRT
ncbi:MAG: hypothetical protein AB7F09_16510 [Parvibaculaceae bacterium]